MFTYIRQFMVKIWWDGIVKWVSAEKEVGKGMTGKDIMTLCTYNIPIFRLHSKVSMNVHLGTQKKKTITWI